MKVSRRGVLRRMGAAAAAAAAVPHGLRASPRFGGRRPSPVRLSLNESAYGPSQAALAALRGADVTALSLYPDIECDALQRRLAGRHAVPIESVVLGCGAGDLVHRIARDLAGPGTAVIAAAPMGTLMSEVARGSAEIVRIPLAHDWSHDLPAMRRACSGGNIVYICNPHNPTGSLTPRAALDDFIRTLPANVHVIVDETYHHYVGRAADYVSFLDRPPGDRRVIVVRSFSKAYGLAGARVGYAVAEPAVAARLHVAGGIAPIPTASALAAAAAFDDQAHLTRVVGCVADDRQEFANQANARMLRVIDSHTNFVMLNTARRAVDIVDHFARNGVSLPAPFAPLDEYVRVSLGTRADMAEFWRVWDLMSLGHTG